MSGDERLLRGYSGRLLLSVSLGWLTVQGGRLLLSPLLPAIRDDLHLSATAAGVALTTLWGLYALLQYPSGRLSDRLSRKTPLVVGLLAAAVGFLALSLAPNYPVFLLGAATVGVGVGLYPTAARALVSELYVERRGQAFGLHTGSGDFGGVVAAVLAAAVLALSVWRIAFLPILVVVLLIALAIHVFSREGYVFARPPMAAAATGKRLLADARLRGVLVGYALFAFTWQATAGFLPTFLQTSKSFSPTIANAGFGALFVVGALVKPAAGSLGDRVPRELVAPAALTLGALAMAGLVLAQTPLVATVAVVVFAVGLMSYPPVMQARLMDLFPEESAGGDLGAMRTVYIGVGSLGPTYVGVVADYWNYTVAFATLVGCLALAALLVGVFGRDR